MSADKTMSCFVVWLASFAPYAAAQNYDYHLEEAPAISWNGTASQDARMLSLGGVSLLASGAFAGSANPALIPGDTRFGIGFTADRLAFEAYQYWDVNQGFLWEPSPLSDQTTRPGGFAVQFASRTLRASAGWYLSGVLRFPDYQYQSSWSNEFYRFTRSFSGTENTFFLAAALPPWRGVGIGGKLEYISGSRKVTIQDVTEYDYVGEQRKHLEDAHEESHETAVLVPSLGLTLQLKPHWTAAALISWPLAGTAERTVTRSFTNVTDSLVLRDTHSGSDRCYRPKRLSLGTAIELDLSRSSSRRTRLRAAAETEYARWSAYRYVFFGEELDRDFKDTVSLAAGLELAREAGGRSLVLRVGYRLDPQPVRVAATTLHALTGGAGVRFKGFGLDLGVAHYRGSPGGIGQNHSVVGLTLSAEKGRTK